MCFARKFCLEEHSSTSSWKQHTSVGTVLAHQCWKSSFGCGGAAGRGKVNALGETQGTRKQEKWANRAKNPILGEGWGDRPCGTKFHILPFFWRGASLMTPSCAPWHLGAVEAPVVVTFLQYRWPQVGSTKKRHLQLLLSIPLR